MYHMICVKINKENNLEKVCINITYSIKKKTVQNKTKTEMGKLFSI